MAKKKQEVKLKEPVRIRFKQLANGNQSIYLNYLQVMLLDGQSSTHKELVCPFLYE